MAGGPEGWRPWREAAQGALYGPGGLFTVAGAPGRHFRTSVHASGSGVLAEALAALAAQVDTALDSPALFDLVDVGAGDGTLLQGIVAAAPPGLRARLRPLAVEVAPRPKDLPAMIGWTSTLPDAVRGLLVANEWLDNVVPDMVVVTADDVRVVEVDQVGDERPGEPAPAPVRAWLDAWWPLELAAPGTRAEAGGPRDTAWAEAVTRVSAGVALTLDYAHDRADRAAGRYPDGTLAAHRDGRTVAPVPDGSCDLTWHVALDACAAAAEAAAAGRVTATLLTNQRALLRGLGVSGGQPDHAMATHDPAGYVRALARAGEAAELTDPAGLGGFGALLHAVGLDPTALSLPA